LHHLFPYLDCINYVLSCIHNDHNTGSHHFVLIVLFVGPWKMLVLRCCRCWANTYHKICKWYISQYGCPAITVVVDKFYVLADNYLVTYCQCFLIMHAACCQATPTLNVIGCLSIPPIMLFKMIHTFQPEPEPTLVLYSYLSQPLPEHVQQGFVLQPLF